MLMNSAFSPTEVLQANAVSDTQVPLMAGDGSRSGEGTRMIFLHLA